MIKSPSVFRDAPALPRMTAKEKWFGHDTDIAECYRLVLPAPATCPSPPLRAASPLTSIKTSYGCGPAPSQSTSSYLTNLRSDELPLPRHRSEILSATKPTKALKHLPRTIVKHSPTTLRARGVAAGRSSTSRLPRFLRASEMHLAAKARQPGCASLLQHFLSVVSPPSVLTAVADRCFTTNRFGQQKFGRFHWTSPAAIAALRAEFAGRLSVLREPRRLRRTGTEERRSLACRGPDQGVRDAGKSPACRCAPPQIV